MLVESNQNSLKMLNVLVDGYTVNEQVFPVHDHYFVDTVVKDIFHYRLKFRGCVTESHWHHEKFKVPVFCSKGRFLDVLQAYSNLMKCSFQI